MTETELIDQLDKDGLTWAAWTIRQWLSSSHGFRAFARDNAKKIYCKLCTATEAEDRGDVLAEVEFACCFLADPRFSLQYEPYGTADGRNPDFRVCATGLQDFHLEVKRIREPEAAQRIKEFIQTLVEGIKQVPSSLGFCIAIMDIDEPSKFASRLRDATPSVVALCIQAVQESENRIEPDEEMVFPILGFEKEIRLTVTELPGKSPASPTAYLGGCIQIPYTQKESFKFSENIVRCIGQLRPETANVLAVKIDSSTHDPRELRESINELWKKARNGHDSYFSDNKAKGAADFLDLARALSAVVVKSIWAPDRVEERHNFIWCNPDATIPLSSDILEHLRSM